LATQILRAVERGIKEKYPGRTAPFRALDCIWAAVTKPFDEGLAVESKIFRECLFSDESKALVQEFFDKRTAKKALQPEA
jgi:3-hydroxyacyl-CoA dehydrogenase